jgi:hypothetical protein
MSGLNIPTKRAKGATMTSFLRIWSRGSLPRAMRNNGKTINGTNALISYLWNDITDSINTRVVNNFTRGSTRWMTESFRDQVSNDLISNTADSKNELIH